MPTAQLVLVLLVGLAAFRMSRLVALDTIIDQQRHAFFRRFPPDEDYSRYVRTVGKDGEKGEWQVAATPRRPLSKVGQLVICPWCTSVWFCAAIVGYLAWHGSVPEPVLVWGASCSVAGLAAKMAA